MRLVFITIYLYIFSVQEGLTQELVQTLQPTTFIYYESAQKLSDSITRYFLISDDSKYGSKDLTYVIDYNFVSKVFTTREVLDTVSYASLTASYDLFHVPLPDGRAIIGSNAFDCDISFSELLLLAADGTIEWQLDWNKIPLSNDIKSIGLIENDIMVIHSSNTDPLYIGFNNEQLFFDEPPLSFFNIVKVGNYFYGTNDKSIYKLNIDFDIIDTYTNDSIKFFQSLDDHSFLVGTTSGIAIVDTALSEVATGSSIEEIISGTKVGNAIWVIDHVGLHLLDSQLIVEKTYLPAPEETMKHVTAFGDTVYVASEYNGINHQDFVVRKYVGVDSMTSLSMDASIENLHFPEKVIRETLNGYPYAFTLRFDSLGVDVFNHGEDTIHSLVINIDWRSEIWCVVNLREWELDSILILPQEMATLQLGSFTTDVMYYGAPPQFCFWVDYANKQPDVWPANNLRCGNAEIINKTFGFAQTKDISVYPNPAQDYITLEIKEVISNNFHCGIVNSHGVYVDKIPIINNITQIDVQDYPPGIYFIYIADGFGNITNRLFAKI